MLRGGAGTGSGDTETGGPGRSARERRPGPGGRRRRRRTFPRLTRLVGLGPPPRLSSLTRRRRATWREAGRVKDPGRGLARPPGRAGGGARLRRDDLRGGGGRVLRGRGRAGDPGQSVRPTGRERSSSARRKSLSRRGRSGSDPPRRTSTTRETARTPG